MKAPDTDARGGEVRYLKADVLAVLDRAQVSDGQRAELAALLEDLPDADVAAVLTIVRRLVQRAGSSATRGSASPPKRGQ